MGSKSSNINKGQNNRSDGRLLSYARNTFTAGVGGQSTRGQSSVETLNLEVLVVAGGGGGGANPANAPGDNSIDANNGYSVSGGAGGLSYAASKTIITANNGIGKTYYVIVGSGGAAANPINAQGFNGAPSSFAGTFSYGGGGGGSSSGSFPGTAPPSPGQSPPGGSGGGWSSSVKSGLSIQTNSDDAIGYGNSAIGPNSPSNIGNGAAGGAGGLGIGASGGQGLYFPQFSGAGSGGGWYAGGGAGATPTGGGPVPVGFSTAGAGAGGSRDAAANTGSGGAHYLYQGGSGGSGVVAFRYPTGEAGAASTYTGTVTYVPSPTHHTYYFLSSGTIKFRP